MISKWQSQTTNIQIHRKFFVKSWDRHLVQSHPISFKRHRGCLRGCSQGRKVLSWRCIQGRPRFCLWMLRIEISLSTLQVAMLRHTNNKRSTGRTYISRIMHLTFQPVENLLGTVKTNRLEKSANYPLPPSGHSSAATPLRAILEAISTCCHSLPGQRSEVWWPHQGAFTARPGTKWVTNVWPWGMSWNLRHLQFDRTLRWLLIKQILMQGLLCWQLVGETEIHRFLTWFSFFGCMRRHNPVLPSHCPHWEELHS